MEDSADSNIAEQAQSGAVTSIKSFVSGGVGGICAVLVGHPFDLVKVRLQTAPAGMYSGMLDCVRQTVAKDGARGMFRGMGPPLVGVTPMFAISFWGYDLGKKVVGAISTVPATGLTTQQNCMAGFLSAVPMTVVTAPFERVKVLLQIDGQTPGENKYKGPLDVLSKLYKEGGLRSVFRGSLATFARDGPGSAAYFGAYEVVKKSLTPVDEATGKPGKLSIGAIIMAGGTAGLAMWVCVFPLDTIKSQLQSGGNPAETSIGQVVRGTYRRGGIKAFFPGIGPAMLRAYPANAATFLGVELATAAMDKVF